MRDYWDELTLPSGRTLRGAGRVRQGDGHADRLDPARRRPSASTPTTCSASLEPPIVAARTRAPEPTARRLPLEGVKVADFSWIGVGPITAKALADHGATVVHVESDAPADRLRLVGPFMDDVPGINRCQFFGSFNTSKLSLQLNLKHPDGIDLAKQLLAWCDVALDSFTAGTMAELGLGYDVARELNPYIIMATTCLLGQTARPPGLPATATTPPRSAGSTRSPAGTTARRPARSTPTPTPSPPASSRPRCSPPSTTVAAPARGSTSTRPRWSRRCTSWPPSCSRCRCRASSVRRNGNHDPHRAPHDAYPCAGVDEWCAIAVETDEQWRSLRTVLGEPAWAMDPALETLAGRQAAQDAIDRGSARSRPSTSRAS